MTDDSLSGQAGVSTTEEFPEWKLKHLEMIQAIVARLGGNAFYIKGWAVTITGAFVALAVGQDDWRFAAASVGPIALLWLLDALFLRNERLFRDLFARVVDGTEDPFFLGATSKEYVAKVSAEASSAGTRDPSSRFWIFWSPSLRLFYGAEVLVATIAALIICKG
ncbi:MAG: hypothetical protein U0R24_06690 [Solirubrobacterales bacterium]